MKDPLQQKIVLDKFYEVKEIVRTVHVQAGDEQYRLEIYKHYTNPKTPYVASLFVKREMPAPEADVEGETLGCYVLDVSFPWVAKDSAQEALVDALDFLENRHPKRPKKSA